MWQMDGKKWFWLGRIFEGLSRAARRRKAQMKNSLSGFSFGPFLPSPSHTTENSAWYSVLYPGYKNTYWSARWSWITGFSRCQSIRACFSLTLIIPCTSPFQHPKIRPARSPIVQIVDVYEHFDECYPPCYKSWKWTICILPIRS